VPSYTGATQVDILWDFRKASCSTNTVPSLSSLPRSGGVSTLVTSSTLDCTLMELDGVPVGVYGRTYVGWDAARPIAGDDCVVLHFPDAAYMRISYANVIGVNVPEFSLGYVHQTEVQYPTGVTEGGSSGSALLSKRLDYAIIGTLSNGPNHTCGSDRSDNTDKYSSFRRFYFETDAHTYLSKNFVAPKCPTVAALKDNPKAVETLRTVRDNTLSNTATGRLAVRAYYVAAPTLANWVARSEDFRKAFAFVAGSAAQAADLLMR
jgi:hypothetical protein